MSKKKVADQTAQMLTCSKVRFSRNKVYICLNTRDMYGNWTEGYMNHSSVRVYVVIISKYAAKILGSLACVHGAQDQKQSTFSKFKPAQ